MPPDERHGYRVGQLAKRTGLTVRALHHYEAKGLLRPSHRTPAGYRLYAPADVERLYRILALRQLGIPLSGIAEVLRGDGDLRGLLVRQLAEADRRLELQRTLRWKLQQLLQALEAGGVDTDNLIQTMEAITSMDKYFTPEQQADLAKRAEALGPEGMARAEADWAALIAEVRAEMAAGTAPEDARLAPLADRWRGLIRAFTGGDQGIARGVAQRYRDEGFEQPSRGMLDAEVMGYMSQAIQHHGGW